MHEQRVWVEPAGGAPSTVTEWRARRPAVLERFGEIYGRTPDADVDMETEVLADHLGLGSRVKMRQVAVKLLKDGRDHAFTTLVALPVDGPVRGTLVGLNFRGNHTVAFDDRIMLTDGSDPRTGILHYENAEFRPAAPRGSLAHRWPLELIVDRGFAVVTACYLQLGPDSRGVFDTGPHRLLGGGPTRAGHEWGAIGIWAWTLSRMLDLTLEGRMFSGDPGPVYAFGHSRLGKTALWAAAQDERFAGAIANESGAMGAALSRSVGETPLLLAQVRPYWFSPAFTEVLEAGGRLPVDQDALLECLAPRPLLVGSAAEDFHADPEGEYLATQRAARVWDLHGASGLVHHHVRRGEHEFLREDWEHYLDHLVRIGRFG